MPQGCLRIHMTSSLVITIDLKRHELMRTDDETACNRRAAIVHGLAARQHRA